MQRESALRYYLSVFHALVVDVYVALFECNNLAVPIGVAVALAVDVSVEAVRVSLGAPLAMLCLAVTFRFIHLVLILRNPSLMFSRTRMPISSSLDFSGKLSSRRSLVS